MRKVSVARFTAALKSLPVPTPARLRFLSHHYKAPGRALTMRHLARAARYKSYRAGNLWYGALARDVGAQLGLKRPGLVLLVEFAKPKSLTNHEWILVMKPEFAKALRAAKWVAA